MYLHEASIYFDINTENVGCVKRHDYQQSGKIIRHTSLFVCPMSDVALVTNGGTIITTMRMLARMAILKLATR